MARVNGAFAKLVSVVASAALVVGLIPLPAAAFADDGASDAGNRNTAMPLTVGTIAVEEAPLALDAQDANDTVQVSTWEGLQSAIDKASNGQTIQLSTNVVRPSGKDRIKVKDKSVTIDLNGFTLDRNLTSVTDNGHVIEVFDGATLTIDDSSASEGNSGTGVITGGYSKRGGGFYVNSGATLNIKGGTITGNNSSETGGGIYLKGTLNMTGGKIARNTAGESGGGIFTRSESTVSLKNAVISDNTAKDNGGGINLKSQKKTTIEGCEITSNHADDYGGGIYSDCEGYTLKITNTKIDNNTSGDDGAGIYLQWDTIEMTGGSLSGNITDKDGGGAKVTRKTTFTATNVDITGNKALSKEGGGIKNFGTTTLTSCTVSGNTAEKEGGGIYNGDDDGSEGKLTLNDGTVEYNSTPSYGGGIYSNKKLFLNGVGITGNFAGEGGDGIYVGPKSSTTYIAGKLVVKGNSKHEIYLTKDRKIGFSGPLVADDAEGAQIGVTMYEMSVMTLDGIVGSFTTDYKTYNSLGGTPIDPSAYFFSTEGLDVGLNGSQEVQISSAWKSLQAKIDAAAAGENGGLVTLDRDYTAAPSGIEMIAGIGIGSSDDRLEVKSGTPVTIDLAGHTLNRNLSRKQDDGHVIEVLEGATLTIKDGTATGTSPGAGKIIGGNSKQGGGIYVKSSATLNLEGGTITGNTAAEQGGGVCVKGTLDISGGAIIGNTAGKDGGGVFVADGKAMTMSAGTIAANKTDSDGGGICVDGSLTMTGGTIGGDDGANTAAETGGGIYVETSGTITLRNATITNNTAKGTGGGINMHLNTAATTFENCTISNNRSGKDGGGLRMDAKDKKLTITNSHIDGNESGDDGGGVCLQYGTIEMSGSSVAGNKAKHDGGGVKVTSSTTFSASSVVISGNEAGDEEGGGVKNLGSTTLQNCTISANSSGSNGGGIYSDKTLTIKGGTIGESGSDAAVLPGNTAEGNGGGVYIASDAGATSISGAIAMKDNTAAGRGDDLYLRKGRTLTLTGEIDGTDIGSVDMEKPGTFTTGYYRHHPRNLSIAVPAEDPNNPARFFSTDVQGGAIPAEWTSSEEEAQLNSDWPSLQDLIDAAADGANDHVVKLDRSYTASVNDERLLIRAGATVTIDLAGYTLNRNLSSKKSDGNVIEVFENATLTIKDSSATDSNPGTGKITGGYPGRGGGIYVNEKGMLKIEGGTITGNHSSAAGGGIYLLGKLEMTGGRIIDNIAGESGGGIFAGAESTVSLKDAAITGNSAEDNGGGINLKSQKNTTIENCEIAGNHADDYGGGIYSDCEGYKLTINNTRIDNNTSGDDGAGVYLHWDTIAMTRGSISNNATDNDGGGVKVTRKTTFIATGVDIIGNKAKSEEGGGVKNYGVTTLKGCTISQNSSKLEGGGVFNNKDGDSKGELTLDDCTIEGNTSQSNGGGVYSSNSVKMIGGTITGNNAYGKGGGVFIGRDSSFVGIEGGPVVSGNTSDTFGNNVFLRSGKKLTLTGKLTAATQIGVDLEDGVGVLTNDYKVRNGSDDPSRFFVSAIGYDIGLNKDGEVEIGSSWKLLKDRIEAAKDGDVIKLDGEYNKDFAAKPSDDRMKIEGNKRITIDLNGHTLNRNRQSKASDGHVFEVFDGSTLTIIDSSTGKTGTITGGWSGHGGGIYVNEDATLNLAAGTIIANKADDSGGGIYAAGTLNMTGGAVAANTTEGSGGGIRLSEGAKMSFEGGTVSENQATKDGGGISTHKSASISIAGSPVVKDNAAGRTGSDIYLPSGNRLLVTGALGDGALMSVALENDWGVFTSGYGSYNSGKAPASCFSSPLGYAVLVESGEAALGLGTFGETDYEKPFIGRKDQVNVNTNALSAANWMAGISGERYLNEINLPGSHDSAMNSIQDIGAMSDFTSAMGALWGVFFYSVGYMVGANLAKTQTTYIDQQLVDGARVLDLRLNDRYKERKWYLAGGYGWADDGKNVWLSHGTSGGTGNYLAVDEDGDFLSFAMVLDQVKDFLEKHPTETIILHIRHQYPSTEGDRSATVYKRTRAALERSALMINPSTKEPYLYKESDSSDYFAPYKHVPQLKDCRGKIVLFFESKEAVAAMGGFYKDGDTTNFTDPTHHGNTAEDQVDEITESYRAMNNGDVFIPSNAGTNLGFLWHWELNCTGEEDLAAYFAKAAFSAENPVDLANYVNPALIGEGKLFNEQIAGQYIGWVKMDDFAAKYAKTIWRTNFFDGLEYCTVTVKSGLGTNYPDQTYKVLKGTSIEVPGNIYKRLDELGDSRFFGSWKAEGANTDAFCSPGEVFKVDEDVTFTAQWLEEGKTPVRIEWKDGGNADKLRPQSVELSVAVAAGDGEAAGGAAPGPLTLTLTDEDGWVDVVKGDVEDAVPNWTRIDTTTGDGLGQDADGRYRYEKSLVKGAGYILTFYHTPQATVGEGTVVWDDDDDADGLRPDSVSVHLCENGEVIDSKDVTEADGWQFNFGAHPKYLNGEEVAYSIVEDDVGGYLTVVNGFTVTNVHSSSGQDAARAMGVVEWDDGNNANDTRPEKVTVRLWANGEEVDSQEVRGAEFGFWTFSFNDLAATDAQGQRITYSVAIDEVPGYDCVVKDLTPEPEDPGADESGSGYSGVFSFRITNTLTVPDDQKEPSAIEVAPAAYDLVYNGDAQSLVKAGACSGGKLLYALGADGQTAPDKGDFGVVLPMGTEAGLYYVWYYVKGDAFHKDFEPECVTATIGKRPAAITVDDAAKVHGEEDPTFTGTVEGLVDYGDLGEVKYIRTGGDEDPGTYEDVLTATYTENPNYDVTVEKGDFTIKAVCTLRWLDGNGSVLQEKAYVEGDEPPAYDGKEPTKAATAQYTYKFTGWDGGTVEGTTTTYKPLFSETVNRYEVTFVDYDGTTVLKEAAEYDYGTPAADVERPADPAKAATAEYTYAFKGWTPEVVAVTGDATYKATYTESPVPTPTEKGTLTFDLGGGTLDGKTGTLTIEANVGDTIKLPAAPTREGYTFKYWKGSQYAAGADYKVEGDHAFTAEWEEDSGSKPASPKAGDPLAGTLAPIAALAAASALCLAFAGAALRKRCRAYSDKHARK